MKITFEEERLIIYAINVWPPSSKKCSLFKPLTSNVFKDNLSVYNIRIAYCDSELIYFILKGGKSNMPKK